MNRKNASRMLKSALCAVLLTASVSVMPLNAAAVRIQPIAQEGVVNRIYGSSQQEQEIYRVVSQAVSAGEKTVDIQLSKPIQNQERFIELCSKAVYQVRRDYPESFLSNHTDFIYYYGENGYYRVTYTFRYLNLTAEQKQEMIDEVERIVAEGKQQTDSTVELLRYFQETLCKRVEYDMQAAKSDSEHYPKSYHAYGALMEGKAVCQGYAFAFKMLCDKAQIPCWVVTGQYNEPHAWNYVYLDGEYYQVDVTLDDGNNRASDSPYFLAGKQYTKGYRVEDNSAPGVLSEKSYVQKNSSTKENTSKQQEQPKKRVVIKRKSSTKK